jgi:hypothetical protein
VLQAMRLLPDMSFGKGADAAIHARRHALCHSCRKLHRS